MCALLFTEVELQPLDAARKTLRSKWFTPGTRRLSSSLSVKIQTHSQSVSIDCLYELLVILSSMFLLSNVQVHFIYHRTTIKHSWTHSYHPMRKTLRYCALSCTVLSEKRKFKLDFCSTDKKINDNSVNDWWLWFDFRGQGLNIFFLTRSEWIKSLCQTSNQSRNQPQLSPKRDSDIGILQKQILHNTINKTMERRHR